MVAQEVENPSRPIDVVVFMHNTSIWVVDIYLLERCSLWIRHGQLLRVSLSPHLQEHFHASCHLPSPQSLAPHFPHVALFHASWNSKLCQVVLALLLNALLSFSTLLSDWRGSNTLGVVGRASHMQGSNLNCIHMLRLFELTLRGLDMGGP